MQDLGGHILLQSDYDYTEYGIWHIMGCVEFNQDEIGLVVKLGNYNMCWFEEDILESSSISLNFHKPESNFSCSNFKAPMLQTYFPKRLIRVRNTIKFLS